MGESESKNKDGSQESAKSDEWTGNSEKELLDLVVEIITEKILLNGGEKQ